MSLAVSTATAPSSSRWLKGLLPVLVLVVVGVAATLMNQLSRRADGYRLLETSLARLVGHVKGLNALEWEILHKGTFGPEAAERVQRARQAVLAEFENLSQYEFARVVLVEVSQVFQQYVSAIDQEFLFLKGGQLKEAEEWDEAKVDPSFDKLADEVKEAGERLDALASTALAEVRVWILVLLSASGLIILLLAYLFHKRQRQVEVVDAEQRVLKQANADLERRVQERTAELTALHEKVKVSARQAGRAEVANSVLHNVGNAMNSVNTSISLVLETLASSRLKDLPAATAQLQAHAHDLARFLTQDDRGRHFPAFLQTMSDQWQAEHDILNRESAALNRHLQHVSEIVRRQQEVSGVSGLLEEVSVHAVCQEALDLTAGLLQAHRVQVRCSVPGALQVLADRSRLTQILVNLISNAAQAMSETSSRDRLLRVEVATDSPDQLKLRVVDNGPGITPENLTKIFSYGFTTKKGGHGFGLHGSALGAKEMGGTLHAESEGKDRGATFTLTLPLLAAAEQRRAA